MTDLSKRCALCDLPLATCPHNPDRPALLTDPPAPGAITARYDGICQECREPIRAGLDLIVVRSYTDTSEGRRVHAEGCV